MKDSNSGSKDEVGKSSSPWWGITAILTAWTGLIGFVLGILSTIKGVKKPSNTLNTVLGIISTLLALGAMVFQLVFVLALVFGSSNNDLGELKTTTSTVDSLSYSIDLPDKLKQERIEEEGDRYIYRIEEQDIVRAILITSCAAETDGEQIVESDKVTYLKTYLDELPNDSSALNDFATSFGGVKNLTIGSPEKITEGRYAQKGYAVTIFADHPYSNESMRGEMHIMSVNNGMCAAAWLGTEEIHDNNELKMDDVLSSIKIN